MPKVKGRSAARRDVAHRLPARFVTFWAAQAILSIGTRITRQILPIMAITTLGASAAQVGMLHALLFVPAIAIGLVAGGAIDRIGRLRVARGALLFRAVLLVAAPCLHATALLTWPAFCAIVALYGAAATVSEIADRALVPLLVAQNQLTRANARIATTDAMAEIAGPLIMGLLLAVMLPVHALLADAVCFATAFMLMLRITTLQTPVDDIAVPAGARHGTGWTGSPGIVWSHMRQHPMVLALVGALAASTLGSEWMRAVYTLHAIAVMGLTPFELGTTFAAGGVGLLAGAALCRAGRLSGNIAAMGVALAINALGLALFPIAGHASHGGIPWLIAGQFISDTGLISFLILARSHLQQILADALLPHVFAVLSVAGGVMIAIGAVGAGTVASVFSPATALCLPPVFKIAAAIWLLVVGTRLAPPSPAAPIPPSPPLPQPLSSRGAE